MKHQQSKKIMDTFPDLFLGGRDNLSLIRNFEDGLRDLLCVVGEDVDRDGLQDTPYRVAKAFLEMTSGYREDPKDHLEVTFDVPHRELVLVRDIEFHSMCEHHMLPFYGVAHVGYIPHQKITGLSKIPRMVDGYARRLQVQERLTTQIAGAMEMALQPEGVMVIVQAHHMCMECRGVRKVGSTTVTSAVRGVFLNEPATRAEFLSLIK